MDQQQIDDNIHNQKANDLITFTLVLVIVAIIIIWCWKQWGISDTLIVGVGVVVLFILLYIVYRIFMSKASISI